MNRPIVEATGMGCICAAGDSVEQAMNTLYKGFRNPQKPARIKTTLEVEYPAFEVGSEMGDLDSEATRTTKFALKATLEALNQAQWQIERLNKFRVGVCLGTTVGCTLNNEPFYRDYKKGLHPDVLAIDRYLVNNPALYLARKFAFKGPAATIANACSSGTDAIGLAKTWIESDLCDVAVAGGTDELSRITYLGFISLLITSTEACRPFDKNRKGLNLGEGAGIIILENSDLRKKRGLRSLAQISGYGTFADAYHPTAPHPEGIGLSRAIQQALIQSNIEPKAIGFINTHGTATPNNDEVEGKVIAKMFSKGIPIVSTKAYTGHTLGAAGGIEAIFSIRALLDQKLPATPGFAEYDPQCLIAPTLENIEIQTDYALSNSLAFGGNNSTLIFKRVE